MTQKSLYFDDVASLYFDDVAIVTVKGHDHRIIFWFMTENEAVDSMKNADLIKQVGHQ